MKRLKNVLYPTLFAVACAIVSCALHKPVIHHTIQPVYPVIEETSKSYTPAPIPAVYKPSNEIRENRYKDYKTFKDSVYMGLKLNYRAQELLSDKISGLSRRIDSNNTKQQWYMGGMYDLMHQLIEKNAQLEKTIHDISITARVSTKTKEGAQFSTAFVKNAVWLNFGMLIFIAFVVILNLVLSLKRLHYKPNN